MTEKKNILFLINPISGTGKQKNIQSKINSIIDKSKFNIAVKETEYAGHGIEIAKEEHQNFDIIVAIGGDGTVHEIGTALIGRNCILGIIPTGSGNGLARHLKIPMQPEKALALLNNYTPKKIDTVKLNDHNFLGAAGAGFDAHVAWRFDEAPSRGLMTYLKIAIKEYFNYQPQEYSISFDNNTYTSKEFLITLANSNQYGNNAYISPNSSLNDGLVRLICLKKFPLYMAPILAYKLFNRKILSSNFIKEYKFSSAVIELPTIEMHADGEPVKMDKTITIKVNPKSLNVISNE